MQVRAHQLPEAENFLLWKVLIERKPRRFEQQLFRSSSRQYLSDFEKLIISWEADFNQLRKAHEVCEC
jgi:hypothetical protein